MVVASRYVNQAQLAEAVEQARQSLGPEVIRLRHDIGTDTSGDPAIFFRIILADSAAEKNRIAQVTGRIMTQLFDQLRPYENWGLFPYFSFRSDSESVIDPQWA